MTNLQFRGSQTASLSRMAVMENCSLHCAKQNAKSCVFAFLTMLVWPFSGCDANVPSPDNPPSKVLCNGTTANCDRSYADVAVAMTHNSMANEESGFFAPNQYEGVPRQLADGIRGINWDVYDVEGVATLCHGVCALGNRLLLDGLTDLRQFLEDNPDEVLTLIFQSAVTGELLQSTFEESGILPWTYAHEAGTPWPTLAQLIDQETRLVVFTDAGGDIYPWLHAVWSHAFETPYAAETPLDLSCDLNRGDQDNALFILPHFLTAPLAAPELANEINHNPFFMERVESCAALRGATPRIIQVDFYSVGNVFDVVAELNQ
jgi:hypothetical protein